MYRNKQKGFTLIELLVVVVIISILAGLVGPSLFKNISKSKVIAGKSQMEIFATALDSYKLDIGVYPTTDQGLEALRRQPTIPPVPDTWDGPYLMKEVPLDPWSNPYIYLSPGEVNETTYDLISYGADGKEGGEGESMDIKSWQE